MDAELTRTDFRKATTVCLGPGGLRQAFREGGTSSAPAPALLRGAGKLGASMARLHLRSSGCFLKKRWAKAGRIQDETGWTPAPSSLAQFRREEKAQGRS